MNLNCQDPSNEDYCVEIGYNRDKLPPNPPLNVSMTLAISVILGCFVLFQGRRKVRKNGSFMIWFSIEGYYRQDLIFALNA